VSLRNQLDSAWRRTVILLSRLQFQALTRGGLRAVRRRIRRAAAELASELEFKRVIAP
jgi:hypothetical protein